MAKWPKIDVEKLHLEPGDLLLVKVYGAIDDDMRKRLDALLLEAFPGVKCLVIDATAINLEVRKDG